MTMQTLAGGEIAELREAIRGTVFAPGDPGYDDARKIWNAMFDDVEPALVVRCAGTADVIKAIELARSVLAEGMLNHWAGRLGKNVKAISSGSYYGLGKGINASLRATSSPTTLKPR